MTQTDQMKLVLLYAMEELGGGGRRQAVLQHINDHRYWYKNDTNDTAGATRPSESKWRNNFSYERQHLVSDGCMQSGGDGNWRITEKGKACLLRLLAQAQDLPPEQPRLFTPSFYQRLTSTPLSPAAQASDEAEEDAHYLARVAAEDLPSAPAPVSLSNEPQKKPMPRICGKRILYPRDPAVARRALGRASHLCEADPSHMSFLRRNSPFLYMEPHHLIPLSFTGYFGVNLDREQNIVSLCSNCHNQIHYGRKEDIRALLATLFSARAGELCAILGREIRLEELYQIYGVS